jgi:hypothetical protein
MPPGYPARRARIARAGAPSVYSVERIAALCHTLRHWCGSSSPGDPGGAARRGALWYLREQVIAMTATSFHTFLRARNGLTAVRPPLLVA